MMSKDQVEGRSKVVDQGSRGRDRRWRIGSRSPSHRFAGRRCVNDKTHDSSFRLLRSESWPGTCTALTAGPTLPRRTVTITAETRTHGFRRPRGREPVETPAPLCWFGDRRCRRRPGLRRLRRYCSERTVTGGALLPCLSTGQVGRFAAGIAAEIANWTDALDCSVGEVAVRAAPAGTARVRNRPRIEGTGQPITDRWRDHAGLPVSDCGWIVRRLTALPSGLVVPGAATGVRHHGLPPGKRRGRRRCFSAPRCRGVWCWRS